MNWCSCTIVINLCRQTEHALEKGQEKLTISQNSVNARNCHLTHILVMIVVFLILLGKIIYTVSFKFTFCKIDSQINCFRKIHKKKFTQENHSGNNSSSWIWMGWSSNTTVIRCCGCICNNGIKHYKWYLTQFIHYKTIS